MKKWNNILVQIVIVSLIVLLVVESCSLSQNARLIAPVYWIPVALLILIASLSETKWGGQKLLQDKLLQRLGEMSFVIFMVHQLVLHYTNVVFIRILHFENDIIYIIFTLTATIVVSIVIDKYILKSITQWLTKKIQPFMTARS